MSKPTFTFWKADLVNFVVEQVVAQGYDPLEDQLIVGGEEYDRINSVRSFHQTEREAQDAVLAAIEIELSRLVVKRDEIQKSVDRLETLKEALQG